jgi:hypothetical protein
MQASLIYNHTAVEVSANAALLQVCLWTRRLGDRECMKIILAAHLALQEGGLPDQRQTQVAALVGDSIHLVIQQSKDDLR